MIARQVKIIRIVGWAGIVVSLIAIGQGSIPLFVVAQLIGSLSAFLYNRFLTKGNTWENWVALLVSILAAVMGNQWLMYTSIVIRSISYQLIFERIVKQRHLEDKV